jgi:hypothetical protein
VLLLSLPIPITAGNFETFHKNMQKKNKAEKAKNQLEIAKDEEENERISFCSKRYDGQENTSFKSVNMRSPVSFSPTENMMSQTKTHTNNNTIKNRKSMSPRSPDPHC